MYSYICIIYTVSLIRSVTFDVNKSNSGEIYLLTTEISLPKFCSKTNINIIQTTLLNEIVVALHTLYKVLELLL